MPFIGLVIGLIGVYGVGIALTALTGPVWAPLFQSLGNRDQLIPRLTQGFISTGIFFLSILLVLIGLLVILRLIPSTRPFYQRLMQDRTLISFMLYGVVPLILLIDFDEYQHEELASALILLALAAGAWGYLRSSSPRRRILSLLVAITVAFGITGRR